MLMGDPERPTLLILCGSSHETSGMVKLNRATPDRTLVADRASLRLDAWLYDIASRNGQTASLAHLERGNLLPVHAKITPLKLDVTLRINRSILIISDLGKERHCF